MQGQQKDDELYGKGNLNSALFWEIDTRILKRWSVDPIINRYNVFDANPIWKSDVLGNTAKSDRGKVITGESSFANALGHSEIITFISTSEQKLAKSLSEITGLSAFFDKDGNALIRTDGRFSEDARKDLIKLINDKNFNYDINWAMNSSSVYGGQSSQRTSMNQKSGYVEIDMSDFKSNSPFFDFGMVFSHEFNRGFFGLVDNYTPPVYDPESKSLFSYGERGEIVRRANVYEQQLGYSMRISFSSERNEGLYFQQTTLKTMKSGKVKTKTSIINIAYFLHV